MSILGIGHGRAEARCAGISNENGRSRLGVESLFSRSRVWRSRPDPADRDGTSKIGFEEKLDAGKTEYDSNPSLERPCSC